MGVEAEKGEKKHLVGGIWETSGRVRAHGMNGVLKLTIREGVNFVQIHVRFSARLWSGIHDKPRAFKRWAIGEVCN